MSHSHHTAPALAPGNAPGSAPALTPSQLAHELNNLLDGSLRSVTLVSRQLDGLDLEPEVEQQILKRLQTANASMHLMADVLERYANTPPASTPGTPGGTGTPTVSVLPKEGREAAGTPASPLQEAHAASPWTLPAGIREPGLGRTSAELVTGRGSVLDALTHAVNVYGPAIEQHDIELVTRVDPAVCDLPAGPIYTVLANALNNATQAVSALAAPLAVAGGQRKRHRITASIVVEAADVVLGVTDTGPGIDAALFDQHGRFRFGLTTKAGGHGVGLGVCRQIAADLGGSFDLANHPQGGAQLTLRYPRPAASPRLTREARRAG